MEEIKTYIVQLQQNLGLPIEQSLKNFYKFEVYEEIYLTMFAHLTPNLEKIRNQSTSTGKKLQQLIDLLAQEILTMDLSHISGEKIANGDSKHLLNFIQLLYELSRMFAMKSSQNFQSTPGSFLRGQQSYSHYDDEGNRRHSIMGVNTDLENFNPEQNQYKKKQNLQDNQQFKDFEVQNPELFEMAKAQGMTPEELIQLMMEEANIQNNNESQQTNNKKKQQEKETETAQQTLPKKNFNQKEAAVTVKPNKEFNVLQMERQSSSEQGSQEQEQIDDEEAKQYMVDHWNDPELDQDEYLKMLQSGMTKQNIYNKQKRHKAIEKQIYTDPIVQSRFFQSKMLSIKNKRHVIQNPKSNKKKQKKRGRKNHQQYMVEQIPFELNENQEPNLMSGQPANQQYSQKKYPSTNSQYEQYQGENDCVPSTNSTDQGKGYYEILSESVNKIKNSLNGMRQIRVPEEDALSRQKLLKQRNEYKRLLKDFIEHRNTNQAKTPIQAMAQQNLQKKLKNFDQSNIEFLNELQKEQQSLYYKLRDEKVNYLRKIHRIIFELEKNKIIDEKNQYNQNRQQRNKQTQNLLDSIENAYRDKIDMLKDKLKAQKVERHLADLAQKEAIAKLEKEMKDEQQKQIEELKNMWNCEKEKFNLAIKDDGFLEKKIFQLYKKY